MREISNKLDSLQKNDAYVAATFLDPRYKRKFLELHALHKMITNLGQVCDKKLQAFRENIRKKRRSQRQKLQAQAF